MLGSLTFPGSSLERGTLRKHLFNDRLCRIEFCGRKQRKRPVRSGGSNQKKKERNKIQHTGGEEEEEAEQQVRYRRSGRARPPSARPDFQPAELRRTNQEAIPLIAVQTKPAVALARKYI